MSTSGTGKTLEREPSLPTELPLDFLKQITNDFSDERLIGTGSFGSVYKGILEDGSVLAVKKLQENAPVPRDQIFEIEVENIMVLEHKNIVNLLAFCREEQKKLLKNNDKYITVYITETILCYEYFPKGSIDKHIFGDSNTIGWNTRFEIIKGISMGVEFLHSLLSPVLHLGLKPQNILLDDNMVPKIADFGFSRIFGEGQTRKITRSQLGTVGYMAPEYLYKGEISARSDIYSLGLIILEITTGEKNSSSIDQKHATKYIEGVRERWIPRKIMSVYPELDDAGISEVEACIEIGLLCVKIDQDKRPSIKEIILKLSGGSLSPTIEHM